MNICFDRRVPKIVGVGEYRTLVKLAGDCPKDKLVIGPLSMKSTYTPLTADELMAIHFQLYNQPFMSPFIYSDALDAVFQACQKITPAPTVAGLIERPGVRLPEQWPEPKESRGSEDPAEPIPCIPKTGITKAIRERLDELAKLHGNDYTVISRLIRGEAPDRGWSISTCSVQFSAWKKLRIGG